MNNTKLSTSRILVPVLVVLALLNIALLVRIGGPALFGEGSPLLRAPQSNVSAQPEFDTPTPSLIPSPEPTQTNEPAPTLAPQSGDPLRDEGIIILSMRDGNYAHLFAYHPLYLPLTRLTDSAWDDIHPAVSPDGSLLAFSSRRNGYWDIYILSLSDGSLSRVTDTPEYDGWPTWSPDGQWLAYESYVDNQLDIFIRSIQDPDLESIRLTEDPGIDSMPHWSPDGRRIAFVSTRSGEEEIWIANLDQVDERFINISQNTDARERAPRWSPDGCCLAWSAENNGESTLMLWVQEQTSRSATPVGTGHFPTWSPDGSSLLAEIRMPNRTALAGYAIPAASLRFPGVEMPGAVMGMDWKDGSLPSLFHQMPLSEYASLPAGPLWLPVRSLDPSPGGRQGVVPLEDVEVPYAYLHDGVDESFRALRERTGIETGWDLLSSLESAYAPLTEPPDPIAGENWMLTGRSIALNPMPLYAGWMALLKEEFNGQIYWRVYLKTRYQDGSQGMPITQTTWDLNARYSGNSRAYEEGGRPGTIPEGYWIDFTELAARFGWERLPALQNWRTFYPSTRFNQFILSDGLDWRSAMNEIYPPEALVTATSVPTPTPTATNTPRFTPRPTQTATPTHTPTVTATIQPTWTTGP
jgi:TolB protein